MLALKFFKRLQELIISACEQILGQYIISSLNYWMGFKKTFNVISGCTYKKFSFRASLNQDANFKT